MELLYKYVNRSNFTSAIARILVLLLILTAVQIYPNEALASVDGVSITLGPTPVENGIHAWAGDNPNGLLTGTVAGTTYWQTNNNAASPGTYYFYMNVDDAYLQNNTQDVQITVKYFDEGGGKLLLNYDSTSAAFKDAPLAAYTNTGTWKTHTFELNDAAFANRTNGADFRIGLEGGGAGTNADLKVASVTVTKTPSVKITNIHVTATATEVEKGGTLQFIAEITPTNATTPTVTWSVVNQDHEAVTSGTTISDTGLLTVANNETAASLIVTASSTADQTIKGTYSVSVSSVPYYALLEFSETVVEKGVTYTRYNGNPSSEAQTFVEEYKGDIVGRINTNKYLYGTLPADSPLRGIEDVIFTIQYYDVGSNRPYLELGQKSTGHAYNNRHFIQLYNTGELVTLRIVVSDAQMNKKQNGGADFRISAAGGNFYVKSIRIAGGKDTPIDETAPPVFAEQTPSNNMIGKTVSGYQMWFAATETNTGWVHWGSGARPGVGKLNVELWPDVREYPDTALFNTDFDNLENGEQAKLFTSKNKDVVDLHASWLRDYGIDGLAVQRFYNETQVSEIPVKNHINLVQEAAEKYNKLFYVMYDMSGSGSAGDAAIERIKKDWVYNIERKGIVSSTSYAHANGKPVVCLWGLAGNNPTRYPSAEVALTLIHWFQDRGYYVIGGLPDNTWASVTNDYAEVYQSIDMASPWTVGRFSGTEGAKNWWKRLDTELAYCEKYGVDFQPVIFPGFAWSNMRKGVNSPPLEIPRDSGDFMWTQAALLREHGLKSMYIAMFDEYDEGTAIMKGAEDSYMIPKGEQYVYTHASEGTWLSSDYYLRLAGAIANLSKRDITEDNPVSYVVPVEHSTGPVYWRNGFEKRVAMGGELTNVDVGIYNPDDANERDNPAILKRQHTDLASDSFAIEKDTYNRGAYSFRFNGTSEGRSENSQLYARIAPTKIKVQKNLELSYFMKPENDLGRHVFIDLLFDDGTYLSDTYGFDGKNAKGKVGEWEELTYYVNSSFAGKTIVAVIAAYDNAAEGEFTAYIDDITIQSAPPMLNLSPAVPDGSNGWYTSNVTVSLSESDNMAGVVKFEYQVNNGPWTAYTGTLPAFGDGLYTIHYRGTDQAGHVKVTQTVEFKIDKTAPSLSVQLDKTSIWPPNNQMVVIDAALHPNDTGSGVASVELTSITSNEPAGSQDDIAADLGTAATSFSLRAARLGTGSGRIYTIKYTITDKAGNQAVTTSTVTVPHDQSGNH
ncbi:hypothetical protein DVH26_12255 [Paenibacillus sp. H1-7]|uniref:OmpL47-type beta-barrel domain-containing protein n=1 Tax=Paenibacillus sp. H1-7 TaxID=2282849 RepID=UPI001EF77218|nr:Ig-like domain-containing protein [Paenibacillus sp. H1-7]ULL15141.1 hypothetical protein DVH26_12255 [Paenibacillus sp. H1-7]